MYMPQVASEIKVIKWNKEAFRAGHIYGAVVSSGQNRTPVNFSNWLCTCLLHVYKHITNSHSYSLIYKKRMKLYQTQDFWLFWYCQAALLYYFLEMETKPAPVCIPGGPAREQLPRFQLTGFRIYLILLLFHICNSKQDIGRDWNPVRSWIILAFAKKSSPNKCRWSSALVFLFNQFYHMLCNSEKTGWLCMVSMVTLTSTEYEINQARSVPPTF